MNVFDSGPTPAAAPTAETFQEKVMSIRIVTATTPTQRPIMDVTILQLRHAQHKAPKIVGIAGLLAAALTANIADAAISSHHQHYRASMPAHYTPAYPSRYDRGVSG